MTLAARAHGLESISQVRSKSWSVITMTNYPHQSQEAPAKYQLMLRKHLPIPDNEIVMLAMSMGYPDLEKIGLFSAKQQKRPVEDIVQFFGI
jgi:hypothetical protein